MKETIEVERILKQVEQTYMRVIPNQVATVAVNFSKERFRAQNWVDITTKQWPRRKGSSWGRKAARNKGRNILVDTGRLRRSIRKIKADHESIIIGSDVPYAQVHNDGFRGNVSVRSHARREHTRRIGTGVYSTKTKKEKTKKQTLLGTTVKSHTRKMKIPQRRFIGESEALNRQIERAVTAAFIKALK